MNLFFLSCIALVQFEKRLSNTMCFRVCFLKKSFALWFKLWLYPYQSADRWIKSSHPNVCSQLSEHGTVHNRFLALSGICFVRVCPNLDLHPFSKSFSTIRNGTWQHYPDVSVECKVVKEGSCVCVSSCGWKIERAFRVLPNEWCTFK